MSKVYERSSDGAIDFNMTPMIDVTFQLILFFILAGSFASEILAKIEVPDPLTSQAEDDDKSAGVDKLVVNVVSRAIVGDEDVDPYEAGQVNMYKIGKVAIPASDPVFKIQHEIESIVKPMPEKRRNRFILVVRADRRVHFSGVLPVLNAAVNAGVSKMRITAVLEGE